MTMCYPVFVNNMLKKAIELVCPRCYNIIITSA